MNLDKLIVSETSEQRTELVVVKATLAFEMVDGKCTEESLQPLYDLVAPAKVEPVESEVISSEFGEPELGEYQSL